MEIERAAVLIDQLRFGWEKAAPVLAIEHFAVAAGERVFLRGASGSGKSCLLGLIGGLLSPGSGTVVSVGRDMGGATAAQRDRVRADHLGVIFQILNLLPFLSATQNVLLPCRFSARREEQAADRAGSPSREAALLLARLGLTDPALLARPSHRLSVGQQQRVAAARALIGSPSLIIADEPTSALDGDSKHQFIELLLAQVRESGAALLFVSHDAELARHFDRCVELEQINQVRPGR